MKISERINVELSHNSIPLAEYMHKKMFKAESQIVMYPHSQQNNSQ